MGAGQAAGVQGEGSGDDCVFELWGGSGGDEGVARWAGGGVFEFADLAVEERYWCLRVFLFLRVAILLWSF